MPSNGSTNRRLAAILFADIVGYTAMMQSDEGEAVSRLSRYQSVLASKVASYNGELVKNYGDGSLSLFSSVLDAVQCAKAIQLGLQKEPKVPLRIGIHLGDVMYRDDDVYGNAINIASRIESMGVAGSILMSKGVFEKVKNQSQLTFTSLGAVHFKNVEELVEVFALAGTGLSVPEKINRKSSKKYLNRQLGWGVGAISVILLLSLIVGNIYKKNFGFETIEVEESKSMGIAVLPLINLNSSKELEYFSDGVTQEIIDELAKIKSLNVSAFTSTYIYKGLNKAQDIIASELDVNYLISGSSRFFEQEKKVILSIELIDPFTKKRIWSKTFNEELNDSPSIQTAVAQNVADNLNIQLSDSEEEELQKKNTESGEAFRLYLQAKAEINKLNEQGFETGTRYLEESIQLDPDYLQAHTLLAWRYAVGGSADLSPGIRSTFETVDLASPYLEKAIALDSTMSDNYLVRANLKLYSQNKIQDAKKDVELALQLNSWPRIPTNYCMCTAVSVYIAMNDAERAEEVAELAKEIDPQHALYDWDLGNIDLLNRNYLLAQEDLERSVQKANAPIFNAFLGLSYYANGQYDKALEFYQKAYDLSPLGTRLSLAGLSNSYLKLGNQVESDRYLQEMVERREGGEYNLNLYIAYVYLERNERERALDNLELGVQNSDFGFSVFLQLIPGFEQLWDEPRYKEVLRSIQYPFD